MDAKLIVLMGNIGTGKTSYRKKHYDNDEKIICPDEWIIIPEEEKHQKLVTEIINSLKENRTVILDGINFSKRYRKDLVFFASVAGSKSILINFGPGDETSLIRRISTSPEHSPSEWRQIHEYNLNRYQEPSNEEGFEKIINQFGY
jgi:tRNA uridine 5-carbamoylmethylation protein Kti12